VVEGNGGNKNDLQIQAVLVSIFSGFAFNSLVKD
jgi:hypothetical protein